MMREHNPITQFKKNPLSRVSAMKAMCARCVGCSDKHLETAYRASISACSCLDCPMHGFRPYQQNKVANSPLKA
jgi:hypothetical protein